MGLSVWTSSPGNRELMPIITPAYPSMNSSLSVSRQTLQIMIEELVRANNILDELWRSEEAREEGNADGHMWERLFEPSEFFTDYGHYLALVIVGPNRADLQSWTGFVESRLRKLVSDQLGKSLPLSKLQLWPKKVRGRAATIEVSDERNESPG